MGGQAVHDLFTYRVADVVLSMRSTNTNAITAAPANNNMTSARQNSARWANF